MAGVSAIGLKSVSCLLLAYLALSNLWPLENGAYGCGRSANCVASHGV